MHPYRRIQHHGAATLAPVVLLLILGGCGDGTDARNSASPPPATTAGAPGIETARAAPGRVTFQLSGESRSFDYLPADRNTFSSYGSTITAKPSASATETLSITFLSIDLSDLQYPTTLPPAKDLSQPMSPSLAMANVGFSYTDESGNEWAGPGTLQLESFQDGRLTGSFDTATVPHTEKTLSDAELVDGSFSVQLR